MSKMMNAHLAEISEVWNTPIVDDYDSQYVAIHATSFSAGELTFDGTIDFANDKKYPEPKEIWHDVSAELTRAMTEGWYRRMEIMEERIPIREQVVRINMAKTGYETIIKNY